MDAFKQWHICLSIGAEVIDGLSMNAERCRDAAQRGYANATELADYLVEKGIPFRTAHDLSGQAVLKAIELNCGIEDLSLSDLQAIAAVIEDDVYPVLDLDHLLDKRNILGGTGAQPVTLAMQAAREWLQQQEA
jgi:argininosuccinate lyase